MLFDRIRPSIDVDRMQASHLTMVGGANGLVRDLVRCGLGSVTLVDFDTVDVSNPARQDFYSTDLGMPKPIATAIDLKKINPDVEVSVVARDYCELSPEEHDELFGHTDAFVFAADQFPPHARGNLESLRLGVPGLWTGLYQGGRAGEIVFSVPGVTPACYRCVCSSRYEAFQKHAGATEVASIGGTILDLRLLDAVAGQVAVGLLTRGAENRMGRLIEQLGNRNLIQVKMDPEWRLGSKDIFRSYLGNNPANFSFSTIALPMEREENCPDCAQLAPGAVE